MSYIQNNYSEFNKNPPKQKEIDKKPRAVTEYVIKIDSIDRDIASYPDPFSFKVKFNASNNEGSNPVVYARYQNIKYIKLHQAMIPRYNITKFFKDIDLELYNNCCVRSTSIVKINKNPEIKIKKGDRVKINNKYIEILDKIEAEIDMEYIKLILGEYPPQNSDNSITIESDYISVNGIFQSQTKKLSLIFKKNYNISLEAIEKNDLIVLENEINEIDEFDKAKSEILVKYPMAKPIDCISPVILKPDNFQYLHGEVNWKGNILVCDETDFSDYGIGSIIYLSASQENQPSINSPYCYLTIQKFISQTKIQVKKVIGSLTEYNGQDGKKTIYNYSFINRGDDLNDTKYILLNVDEFNNDVCQGTNPKLSQAFGILFPCDRSCKTVTFKGLSDRLYPTSDLQNLNKMTISFLQSNGEKIKLDNLNPNTPITDIRNPLNPINQVLLTFKIGVMEEKFDPQETYNPVLI